MAADILPNLDTNSAAPASVTTGAGSVSQHSLDAQIKLDRYLRAKNARGQRNGGVIFGKMLPAGPCPDQQGTSGGGGSFDSSGDL